MSNETKMILVSELSKWLHNNPLTDKKFVSKIRSDLGAVTTLRDARVKKYGGVVADYLGSLNPAKLENKAKKPSTLPKLPEGNNTVEKTMSGHLYRGSPYETSSGCGNCDGGRCNTCKPRWRVYINGKEGIFTRREEMVEFLKKEV
ncbi:MAG: hypothetical protein ACOCQD_02970 [archaeon]